MSQHQTLRRNLLAGFLAVGVILAIGMEIRLRIQTHAAAVSISSISAVIANPQTEPSRTARPKRFKLSAVDVARTRFYAPFYAPITLRR